MATSDDLGEFSVLSSGLSDLDSGGMSQGGKETVRGMVVNFSAQGIRFSQKAADRKMGGLKKSCFEER